MKEIIEQLPIRAYVRTSKGFETDFFARHKITRDVQLIQVCWDLSNENTFAREVRGLDEVLNQFGIDQGTIVTWDDSREIGNGIKVVPVWRWMI